MTAKEVGSSLTHSRETTQNRLMFAIVLGPFLGNLVMLAPPPFFPLMSNELGISVPLLGQVMTGMLLLSAVLALVVGPLADRYGHRRLMLIGIGAAVSSLIGFGAASSYATLILAGLIGGLATASLPSIAVAVASSTFSGEVRRRALGWTSSAGAGSAVIGVPLLIAMADQIGWRWALAVAGLLALGGIWLIASSVPGPKQSLHGPLGLDVFRSAYAPLLGDRQTLKILGATVLRTVCWSGYLTYLGTFMHRELELSASQISGMFLIGGAAYIFSSLNTRRLLEWVSLRPAVSGANASMAVLVALVLSGIPGFWLTLLLIPATGIAAGIGWVSIVTLMAEESKAEPGTTMAMNGSAFNLGAAGGGALGGLMLALGGFPAVGVAMLVFATAGAVLVSLPQRAIAPAVSS